ncbi:MAG: exodeoxyribonuclease III [Xanthomonadales bacterium]|nr:exodeoxyribonuclease III [Xanthomonadales bacterium]
MKIASWNVNSLNVRLPHVEQWCAAASPDILALQETKLDDGRFPVDALQAMGYQAAWNGQRTYNGVAILSRLPIQEAVIDIAGFEDPQRRFLAATIGDVRIVNLYVVNGQSVGSPKFEYKLRWLDAVTAALAEELRRHPNLVVLGDFNIAPDDRDVHDPEAWHERILCSTPEREALKRILDLGLHDSFRLQHDDAGHYTWWDYRQAAFRRDMGLRIDLVLVSDALRGRVLATGIDREPRTWERPSDHTPAWLTLAPP